MLNLVVDFNQPIFWNKKKILSAEIYLIYLFFGHSAYGSKPFQNCENLSQSPELTRI
jgi:hypothetical protein